MLFRSKRHKAAVIEKKKKESNLSWQVAGRIINSTRKSTVGCFLSSSAFQCLLGLLTIKCSCTTVNFTRLSMIASALFLFIVYDNCCLCLTNI